MAKFQGGLGYKPRLSHVFIFAFLLGFALVSSLWTWPTYDAYGRDVAIHTRHQSSLASPMS